MDVSIKTLLLSITKQNSVILQLLTNGTKDESTPFLSDYSAEMLGETNTPLRSRCGREIRDPKRSRYE